MNLTPKEWRKAKGYSVTKMAESLSVNPVTWAKWENTPSLIPMGKADEFCRIVGVSPDCVSFLP